MAWNNSKSRKKYEARKPWANAFYHARARCRNPKESRYARYGGRGIKCLLTIGDVESIWKRDKADTMTYPSIDRIDNDGNYTTVNCRFIEMVDNTRRSNGEREECKRGHRNWATTKRGRKCLTCDADGDKRRYEAIKKEAERSGVSTNAFRALRSTTRGKGA